MNNTQRICSLLGKPESDLDLTILEDKWLTDFFNDYDAAGLKDDEGLKNVLLRFSNPLQVGPKNKLMLTINGPVVDALDDHMISLSNKVLEAAVLASAQNKEPVKPEPKESKPTLIIKLPEQAKEALKVIADKAGQSVSHIARIALYKEFSQVVPCFCTEDEEALNLCASCYLQKKYEIAVIEQ